MDTIATSQDVTQNVTRFYNNLEKFFELIKSIVTILRSKGYQTVGPEMIEIGKRIAIGPEDETKPRSHHGPISMFLRLNGHHSSLSNQDIDFFEKNMNAIFDLPDILSGLASSIVKCKKKSDEGEDVLDIPIKSINTMFVAVQALATNGIKILYTLADPSGYKIDDTLGYRVYTWRNDPQEIFDYLTPEVRTKLNVDSFDLSHALHVWKVKDLPDPK